MMVLSKIMRNEKQLTHINETWVIINTNAIII